MTATATETSLADGFAATAGVTTTAVITTAAGTADVCSPIADKTDCSNVSGLCEWTTTPLVAPVDPVPAVC